jgi:hypothetical protein
LIEHHVISESCMFFALAHLDTLTIEEVTNLSFIWYKNPVRIARSDSLLEIDETIP